MALTGNVARGIRNNNPLNIEHQDANKWLGLSTPPSDGRFCRFVSADYGVRAAALLLMRYYDKDGLSTVREIVQKWAPAHENNVSAYVASVCTHAGFSSSEKLDLHDRRTMRKLIAAMAKHETGSDLDTLPINKGLALAGFAGPVEVQSVLGTPTMVAATYAAAPAAAVSVVGVLDAVIPHLDVVPGIVTTLGGPAAGGIALGVVTALSWAYSLYNRLRVRQETGV